MKSHAAYGGRRLSYGADYLIPVPFDPRLIVEIPVAVAEAAMKSGVARKPIDRFRRLSPCALRARLDPTAGSLESDFRNREIRNPRRVVFAEGEEERVIRAALQFKAMGYGTPFWLAVKMSCASI